MIIKARLPGDADPNDMDLAEKRQDILSRWKTVPRSIKRLVSDGYVKSIDYYLGKIYFEAPYVDLIFNPQRERTPYGVKEASWPRYVYTPDPKLAIRLFKALIDDFEGDSVVKALAAMYES